MLTYYTPGSADMPEIWFWYVLDVFHYDVFTKFMIIITGANLVIAYFRYQWKNNINRIKIYLPYDIKQPSIVFIL